MKVQARPTLAAGTRPALARSQSVVLCTRSNAAASCRFRMRSGASVTLYSIPDGTEPTRKNCRWL